MSRTSNPHHPSLRETIDLDSIEIVDLTERSPRPARRSLSSPTFSERPTKRAKGKDPEVYISLDDDDDDENEDDAPTETDTTPAIKLKPASQSGSLSQARCVICLDSPTDLVATPCGHLFCDFCIRSALKTGHAGRGRGAAPASYSGSCPICRRKITTRSLVALEIKVRTLG